MTLTQAPHPTLTLAPHEHAWTLESTHSTSQGQLSYLLCRDCRVRQVTLEKVIIARVTRHGGAVGDR